MLICGIKGTHDGGVALVEDGRLLTSVEVEKLDNGKRYSALGRLERVAEILRAQGCDPADVDRFVIDGWDGETPGARTGVVEIEVAGQRVRLPAAPYVDDASVAPLHRYEFGAVPFTEGISRPYSSYHHAANHLMGSYCTSPFAQRGEPAIVVVWDGGMLPRAYHVDPAAQTPVQTLPPLLAVLGNIFPAFCGRFGPFATRTAVPGVPTGTTAEELRQHLEVAGKAMAYAALGTVSDEACAVFDTLFDDLPGASEEDAVVLTEKVIANRDHLFPGLTDADLIANFQEYLGAKFFNALSKLVRKRYAGQQPNLCLGGGCALNIKWNSRIRNSGLFRDVWIPPFPNDSGAAIGTAACEMFSQTGIAALEWDVYSGPALRSGGVPAGWISEPCDETRLAAVLHERGEPVVVLSGRAELGPRALGNRSIIAPAVTPRMKELLNDLKGRDHYRPVAPICLASRAPEVFDPGTPDPYMLFEHRMRPGWAERVPAIVHLDGTARLQTIDESTRSPIVAILSAYERLSGIPVLCNTSANLNGHGFFPDVATAAQWGRTRYIWSDGTLYTKADSNG